MRDPNYGLQLAARVSPREFGALAYVGLSSATLGEALGNLARYQQVHSEAWQLDLAVAQGHATLTSTPRVPDFAHCVQAVETGLAIVVNAYRHFTGGRLTLKEIGFVHALSPDRNRSQIEALLGCPVTFSSNRIHISFDPASLQLPITSADDRLLKLLRAHCASILRERKRPEADVSAAVRGCLADGLSKGRAKAKLVAGDLGLTERSLHRKLAAENTSFGEILDGLRLGLAEDYLRDGALSPKQIAFLLGYADQSSFGAAYRRWTGRTPKAARAHPRQQS